MDGGAGIDTASYAGSSAGVTVDLGAGTGTDGDAQGDVLSGIENLTGSNFDDVFTGSASINVLIGGDGDDTLQGLGGNDTLTGGDGSDSFIIGEGDGNDTVSGGDRNLSTTLRHRRFLFTDSFVLLWKWRVG